MESTCPSVQRELQEEDDAIWSSSVLITQYSLLSTLFWDGRRGSRHEVGDLRSSAIESKTRPRDVKFGTEPPQGRGKAARGFCIDLPVVVPLKATRSFVSFDGDVDVLHRVRTVCVAEMSWRSEGK